MVTSAPDPEVRVPATPEWTVAEAFGHLATVVPRYGRGARREGEWVPTADRLANFNDRELRELPTLDVHALAADLDESLTTLTDLVQSFGDDQPVFRFHGGGHVAADAALGILLGELVVHGHDIAAALHRPWPIDPHHVELVQEGLDPILSGWLNPETARGHTGRYEVRLRREEVHRFDFVDGRLTMNPPGPFLSDVVISADPAAFILVVYKRRGQWPAILSGKLAAWGRKPWLAFGFAGLFAQP